MSENPRLFFFLYCMRYVVMGNKTPQIFLAYCTVSNKYSAIEINTASQRFQFFYLLESKSRLLTWILVGSLMKICVLSLVVHRAVLLNFGHCGIPTSSNSVQGFAVLMDCTFILFCSLPALVFSLSLRVLRQCDLCGLPGVRPKVSSIWGLRRGLSEGFPLWRVCP